MFNKKIRELRLKKKMTQKQVAEKLDCTLQLVSNWERGVSYPSASKLDQLCDVLKLNWKEEKDLVGQMFVSKNKDYNMKMKRRLGLR